MKRTVSLSLLVPLLLALTASAAHASSVTLEFIATVGGVTLTSAPITSLSGMLKTGLPTHFDGFTIAYTAEGYPLLTGNPALWLSNFSVTTAASGNSTFEMVLTQNISTPTSLTGPTAQANTNSSLSLGAGTGNGTNVVYTNSVSTTGAPPVQLIQLTDNAGQNGVFTDSGTFTLPSPPSLALSTTALINFVGVTGTATVVGSSELSLVNPPALTPEPGSMVLFGTGVMCLVLFVFVRRRSTEGIYRPFWGRGSVIKKAVLLSALTGLLLSFAASTALAGPLFPVPIQVTLNDGAGHVVTVVDGQTVPTAPYTFVDDDGLQNDSITTDGQLGVFNYTMQTGFVTGTETDPLNPFALQQELQSLYLNANVLAGQTVSFTTTLEADSINLALLGGTGWLQNLTTSASPLTSTFTTWIDTSNDFNEVSPIVGTDLILSADAGNGNQSSNATPTLPGPFSLYTQITTTFTCAAGGPDCTGANALSASATSDSYFSGPIGAPEPSTMMLFGSGLGMFGLASIGRRRSKRAAVQAA
jgi:hypothetical protein